MSEPKFRPTGYLSKEEVASRFGFDTKTLDRRRKTEPLLAQTLIAGKRVWFPLEKIEAYWELGKKRGYL